MSVTPASAKISASFSVETIAGPVRRRHLPPRDLDRLRGLEVRRGRRRRCRRGGRGCGRCWPPSAARRGGGRASGGWRGRAWPRRYAAGVALNSRARSRPCAGRWRRPARRRRSRSPARRRAAPAARDAVAERGELGGDRFGIAGLELERAGVGEGARRVDRRLRVHAEVDEVAREAARGRRAGRRRPSRRRASPAARRAGASPG